MIKKVDILINLLFLLVLYFVLSKTLYASEFIKSENNPLSITFDLNYSEQRQCHVYKYEDKYVGILSARRPSETYSSLVKIQSDDGIRWRMTQEILNYGKDLSNARLLLDKEGNRRIIFAKKDSNDFYRIYGIDCDENLSCDQNPYLVLDNNPFDSTENHGVFAPFILMTDNIYYFFYGAWGNKGFITKLAYSDHFGGWQKCPNEILTDADGPVGYIKNDDIHLFVHNATGIREFRTQKILNCSSTWENLGYVVRRNQSYDQNLALFPSVISDESGLKLYYSGIGSNNAWKLNLAFEALLVPTETPTLTPTLTPTTIPTPTPTSTPTATPSPTPIPHKTPIILIPGAFSSWNKDAILHKKIVNQSEWNLLPFIREYDGLIGTLKNLGYQENKDLFIFTYDWRKPLEKIAEDLDSYINRLKINAGDYSIIGHSLGGLSARIYAQKYQDNKLIKLVTAGSPHRGAAQAYKAVEAGEIDQDNSWLWLSQKLVLQVYRDSLKTDRQILNENFPIVQDLLPTFNYLVDSNGNEVNISLMSVKNDYLIGLNSESSTLDYLHTLSGKGIDTPKGYQIKSRTTLDQLLGNYIDGRPDHTVSGTGDGIVLSASANSGTNIAEFENYNHGDIIYKKGVIKNILNSLDISYSEDQVTEGRGTNISPSLIFLIKSPAEMEAKHGTNTYQEHQGIIFIENAESGEYKLFVKGKGWGKYEIIIGEIGTENSSWGYINGEITSLIPQLETDEYDISFENTAPRKFFIDRDNPVKLIDELILILKQKEKMNKEIINDLKKVITYIQQNKLKKIPKILFDQNEDLIEKKEYFELEKLENIYALMIKNDQKKSKSLNKRFNSLSNTFIKKQKKLTNSKKIKNNDPKLVILEMINKRFESLITSLKNNEYSYSEIALESVSNLLRKL
jgi:pimeloyl-ACP methyl ester carboxylesterase